MTGNPPVVLHPASHGLARVTIHGLNPAWNARSLYRCYRECTMSRHQARLATIGSLATCGYTVVPGDSWWPS